MLVSLHAMVDSQTEGRFVVRRFYDSLKIIAKKKGRLVSTSLMGWCLTSKVAALAISFFCAQGASYSLIDAYNEKSLRPLGDVGGWVSLIFFSAAVLGRLYMQIIREGEFYKSSKILKQALKEQQAFFEENPEQVGILYENIYAFLRSYQNSCLIEKTSLKCRLVALKTCQKLQISPSHQEYCLDLRLSRVMKSIYREIDARTKTSKYFSRIQDGQKSLFREGGWRCLTATVMGIAIPLIFLFNAALCVVGEIGLGKVLYLDQEERTDVGHFGEWPFNGLELVSLALLLHSWVVVHEGDFRIARKIYKRHLFLVKDEPELHHRLCRIANDELFRFASNCFYFKSPLKYRFIEK
ncbi:MAG: hypothetical protein ACSNEK_10315 [Parachlamydiaceae bacterium]